MDGFIKKVAQMGRTPNLISLLRTKLLVAWIRYNYLYTNYFVKGASTLVLELKKRKKFSPEILDKYVASFIGNFIAQKTLFSHICPKSIK